MSVLTETAPGAVEVAPADRARSAEPCHYVAPGMEKLPPLDGRKFFTQVAVNHAEIDAELFD